MVFLIELIQWNFKPTPEIYGPILDVKIAWKRTRDDKSAKGRLCLTHATGNKTISAKLNTRSSLAANNNIRHETQKDAAA